MVVVVVVKVRRNTRVRGSEMRTLGEFFHKELQAMTRLARKLNRELVRVQEQLQREVTGSRQMIHYLQKQREDNYKRLAGAEQLIHELCGHEGAEGWSECLRARLNKYKFTTPSHGGD